ncbi:hypothetical protein F4804DRAFT_274917 [Jackrogersella minutella]|nr:hypothetical protein F4804DRAFT_274917 [Jackrogersella minutella]
MDNPEHQVEDLAQWWKMINSLSERILAVLLCLSVKLEFLLLRKRDGYHYKTLGRIMERARREHRSMGPILPEFSTFYLQRVRDPDVYGESDIAVPPELCNLGNFTQLHIWRDKGRHIFMNDLSWLRRIKELKLVSCIHVRDMYRICEEAISLESLSLMMTKVGVFRNRRPPAGKDLNNALALRADTLKVLEIRIRRDPALLRQLGDSERLECLPWLSKLEELTTEIPLIFVLDKDIAPDVPIPYKLPRNIVSLNLIEWPWQYHHLPKQKALAKAVFNALISASRFELPKLKKLHFSHRYLESCLDLDELEEIKSSVDPNVLSFSYKQDMIPQGYLEPNL